VQAIAAWMGTVVQEQRLKEALRESEEKYREHLIQHVSNELHGKSFDEILSWRKKAQIMVI
jgi:hypothetical protein